MDFIRSNLNIQPASEAKRSHDIEFEIKAYESNESIEQLDVFWCKIQDSNELPFLRNLVRSLLCGMAGIHSSESQFSYANSMIWSSRNRLDHQKLEILSFCHRNLDKYKKKRKVSKKMIKFWCF